MERQSSSDEEARKPGSVLAIGRASHADEAPRTHAAVCAMRPSNVRKEAAPALDEPANADALLELEAALEDADPEARNTRIAKERLGMRHR